MNPKICGRRGLVMFCTPCKDFEPVRLGPVHIHTSQGRYEEGGAWCKTCGNRFPEVESLRVRPASKEAE